MESIVNLTVVFVSTGLLIQSLEDLARRDLFSEKGLLCWSVLRHRAPDSWIAISSRIGDFVQCRTVFQGILWIRPFAIVLLLSASGFGLPLFIPALIVVALQQTIGSRTLYGLDGFHQMSMIVLISLTIYDLATLQESKSLALWFIAAQSITSYFFSGVVKIISPDWRGPSAIQGVFSTQAYGNPLVADFAVKHSSIATIISWSIVVFECIFPVVLVVPSEVAVCMIALAGLLHFSIALTMGLNKFFWAWLSTYPALFGCTMGIVPFPLA